MKYLKYRKHCEFASLARTLNAPGVFESDSNKSDQDKPWYTDEFEVAYENICNQLAFATRNQTPFLQSGKLPL